MHLTFLGVGGSTPAPGAAFVEVGGTTSCVAVGHDGDGPTLVLDAGTGLRRLGELLGARPFAGTIVLSHLHEDHLQGLPFCPAVDRPDAEVTLVIPEQGEPLAVLSRAMSPPHFPIGPDGLQGTWAFAGIDAGAHRLEGFGVTAREIPHKGGRTFGYRVSDGTRSVAYLPDHVTVDGSAPVDLTPALALARGVDVLVHDAQFDEGERTIASLYGHATVGDAVSWPSWRAWAPSCSSTTRPTGPTPRSPRWPTSIATRASTWWWPPSS